VSRSFATIYWTVPWKNSSLCSSISSEALECAVLFELAPWFFHLFVFFNRTVACCRHALTDLLSFAWLWLIGDELPNCARIRHLSMHSACPFVSQYSLKRWHYHYIIKYHYSSFFYSFTISHWLINSDTIYLCLDSFSLQQRNRFNVLFLVWNQDLVERKTFWLLSFFSVWQIKTCQKYNFLTNSNGLVENQYFWSPSRFVTWRWLNFHLNRLLRTQLVYFHIFVRSVGGFVQRHFILERGRLDALLSLIRNSVIKTSPPHPLFHFFVSVYLSM